MPEDVLIRPRKVPGDPTVDHVVIFALFKPYLEILRKELKVKKSDCRRMRMPSMDYFNARSGKKRISVFGPALGAPRAAIMLERMIAMGARKIVAFGCCGSLQPDLKVGDLVIPVSALCEEGTSAHYPLPKGRAAKANGRILEIFRDECLKRRFQARMGKVWTTDALYRETREKTKRYTQKGLLAVEMEMSALFTIAAYRQVCLGGLMVVSDELASLKWKTGFQQSLFWESSQKAARMLIEVYCDF